ncbi:transmembrane protein, putative (macronuclear) [Tetrahymena thermophila SB210]|uniref:Transmembrane protein, putative n=1 Tax=Tetrahymena thermophila (strain SB210) TaxID=312017 RepID=W7XJJ0_TETTS|nr:transmembrane protein, putative [Tetrahymena thermophila SB210]EWS75566.1 transmembrane protein, putative [Tetrahymena thermophila SB210]|eukprot:XP_012651866.1 transmembrane protein, putative [Tetrahymena thermophila SB210]
MYKKNQLLINYLFANINIYFQINFLINLVVKSIFSLVSQLVVNQLVSQLLGFLFINKIDRQIFRQMIIQFNVQCITSFNLYGYLFNVSIENCVFIYLFLHITRLIQIFTIIFWRIAIDYFLLIIHSFINHFL